MIAKVTSGGASFKGAFQYYLHDKGATTRERVAWTHTENLLTPDPDKAWKVMAYTAKEAERLKEASGQRMTGRKLEKPVFAYSLAWHPEQDPDKDHMLATARQSIAALGLTEHEAIIIAHRDEPQRHVHILINRVHPLTGIAAHTGRSKLKLSAFALEHERAHGKIYCHQREENHMSRQRGERAEYRDPHILAAWRESDGGKSFAAALKERGYHLAWGRKRIVVVDPHGRAHNPTRHLPNVRARDVEGRLQDMDLDRLPEATVLSRSLQERQRRQYEASRAHDAEVNRRLNRLQTRQHEERARLFDHHHERIEDERGKLAEHYRLEEQQEVIDELAAKIARPGLWRRLFGLARRDTDRLEELRLGYEDGRSRMTERITHLEQERDRALQAQQQRHEQERQRVLARTEARRPEGYLHEPEQEHENVRFHGRGRDAPRLRP